MAEIYNLNNCRSVSEFNSFLTKLEVDAQSGGRKFTIVDKSTCEMRTYTENEIVWCFEKCVKNSIQNPDMVQSTVKNLKKITEQSKNQGTMLHLRQFFGNLVFAITHSGFNKAQVLADIESHAIVGRGDLTTANMNDQDANGNTALHRKILQGINSETLREIDELLANGADPTIENKKGMNYLDVAYQEAKKNTKFPLKDLFEILPDSQMIAMIQRNYKISEDSMYKHRLIRTVAVQMHSCVAIINQLTPREARDIFELFTTQFIKYADLNVRDKDGNTLLHYGAQYIEIVGMIKYLVAKDANEIGNWTVKNNTGQIPADLAKQKSIAEYLNKLD